MSLLFRTVVTAGAFVTFFVNCASLKCLFIIIIIIIIQQHNFTTTHYVHINIPATAHGMILSKIYHHHALYRILHSLECNWASALLCLRDH